MKGLIMAQAKNGDKVKIGYIGRLADGSIFDSSAEDDCSHAEFDCADDDCGCDCEHSSGPVELVIGDGEMFPQIDEALIGMTPGEKKTVVIHAGNAFGEYDEDQVFIVPRSDMPDDLQPSVGDELLIGSNNGEEMEVEVIEVSEASITFNANHPLAGEDLFFEIELLEII